MSYGISYLHEWVREHLVIEHGTMTKCKKRRIRTIVDLSVIPKDRLEFEQQQCFESFRVYAQEKKKGFAWWMIPLRQGIAFYI